MANQKLTVKLGSNRYQKAAADKRIEEQRKQAIAATPLYQGKDKGGIARQAPSVVQVQPGETFADVATRTGRNVEDILKANADVAKLSTGMGLKVPAILPEPGERALSTPPTVPAPAASLYKASEWGATSGNVPLFSPAPVSSNLFSPVVPTTTSEAGSYLNSGGAGRGYASSGGAVGGYGLANAATVGKNTGQYAYSSPKVEGSKWKVTWGKDQYGNWVKKTTPQNYLPKGQRKKNRRPYTPYTPYTYTDNNTYSESQPYSAGATRGKWSISSG
jgi:LysM repeat protein